MQSLQFFQRIEYDTNCNSDIGNQVFEADPTGLLSNVYTILDVCTLTGPSNRPGA
jgi:hypothetical protein